MSAERIQVIDETWDVSGIEQQKGKIISFVNEYVDHLTMSAEKVKKLDFNIGSALNLQDLKKLQDEADKVTKESAKNVAILADATLKLAKAKTEEAKASKLQTDETTRLTKEKERLDKQQAREQEKLKKLNNEYEVAKRRYKELSDEAKRLYFAEGETSRAFIEQRDAAQALHKELLKVEMSVGQAQRQVGNYNAVGESFNQILREAPNAGLSFRTFIVAISNNISQLVENISKANKNGESMKSIFMSMGKQLVGVTGIINGLVLVMTYMATNMKTNKDEAKSLTEQMDDLTDSLAKYIKMSREGSQVLNVTLSAQAANMKREIDLMKARGDSEADIQKKSQEYHKLRMKDIQQEVGLYGTAQMKVNQYVSEYLRGDNEMMVTKEELRRLMSEELKMNDELVKANLDKIQLAATEAYSIKQTQKISNQAALEKVKVTTMFTNQILDLEGQMFDELNAKEVNKLEFEKSMRDKSAKDYEDYLKRKKKAEEDAEKNKQKDLKAEFDIRRAFYEDLIRQNENIIKNEQSTDEQKTEALKNLTALRTTLAMESADFEASAAGVTAGEIKAIYFKLEIELRKILEESNEVEKKLHEETIQRDKDATELKKQNLKSLGDYFKGNAKVQQDYTKKITQQQIKLIGDVVHAAENAAKIRARLQQNNSERDMKLLDVEEQEAQNIEERERARAERTITDEKKKEEAITQIEANADNKRKEIADKRAAAQRRDAQREKELAMISVIANLIVGISKEIATKGVAGLATSAAIGVYTAALTGTIAALSIPAYEDGVIDKAFDSPAIVGEGVKKNKYVKEAVKIPGKKPFITNGPMFIPNLPKGSDVIPLPGLTDEYNGMVPQSALNVAMLQGAGNFQRTEELLLELINVVSNQEHTHTEVIDGVSYTHTQKGNIRYNHLDKGYYK